MCAILVAAAVALALVDGSIGLPAAVADSSTGNCVGQVISGATPPGFGPTIAPLAQSDGRFVGFAFSYDATHNTCIY